MAQGIQQDADGLVSSGPGYTVKLCPHDIAIRSVVDKTKGTGSIWRSVSPGLLGITFEDELIRASQYSADPAE